MNTGEHTPIGFIGLGQMGGLIVQRLLERGTKVVVYDTDDSALQRCVDCGAIAAASVEAVADAAQVVLGCLPSVEASMTVARAVAKGSAVSVYAELSTIGPRAIDALAGVLDSAGVALLDAPVSGGQKAIRDGTLSMMVSGAPAAVARLERVAGAFVGEFVRIGERAGQSQLCKLVNNALNFTALAVSCEAIAVGSKAGIDAAKLVEVINAGTGRNSATVDKIPRAILPRTFDLGGGLAPALKDIDLYLEQAHDKGLAPGVIDETRSLWAKALGQLDANVDAANIVRYFEASIGVELGA